MRASSAAVDPSYEAGPAYESDGAVASTIVHEAPYGYRQEVDF
jgi:hypothetical protein